MPPLVCTEPASDCRSSALQTSRILLEASTGLSGDIWLPLQNCTLTNGSLFLCDPQWTNYPKRFCRIRSL